MNSIAKLTLAFAAAALSGCAGTQFTRADLDSLKNGQTTYDEVVQRMGAPRRQGTVLKNNKQVAAASYSYAEAGGKSVGDDVVGCGRCATKMRPVSAFHRGGSGNLARECSLIELRGDGSQRLARAILGPRDHEWNRRIGIAVVEQVRDNEFERRGRQDESFVRRVGARWTGQD